MGLIKIIKHHLVKRKKKHKSWQEKTKENCIAAAILLPPILFLLSFTVYGAQFGQHLVDTHPKAAWAKYMQWRSAKLYQFWGSNYQASLSYQKLYTNFRLSVVESIEVEFREASCMRDGEQFASATAKLEIFVEKYRMFQEKNIWYDKGYNMLESLKIMNESKRVDSNIWS
jgi:hypothetical protein